MFNFALYFTEEATQSKGAKRKEMFAAFFVQYNHTGT